MPFYISVPSLITPVHCITQTEEPRASRIPIGPDEEKERVEAERKISVARFRSVAALAKNKTASDINPCHRKTFPRDSPWQKKNRPLWQGQRILWTSRVESETRSRFLFYYSLSFLGVNRTIKNGFSIIPYWQWVNCVGISSDTSQSE